MMMNKRKEEALIDRDYSLRTFGSNETAAREFAKQKKDAGYFVTFAEYATRIRGFHHYAVWYKAKKRTEENM